MDPLEDRRGFLREHWQTGLLLALIVGLALFLRTYFVYNLFAPAGFWTGGGDYSGGSDPFYWEKALLYSFTTGKEIAWDYAMKYPMGFPDVRPPLFDWSNLLFGWIISPLFPQAWDAMVWMLNMNAAIMGALTIIPTYLLGKEAFNRRAGLIGAFLLAISAAALQRSHATIGVHDSWTLFFVVCAFYFYLRALKTLKRRRWVENWFDRASVRTGLRVFFQENRTSVLYACLAGLSVGVTALSWQGWAYVPVFLVLIFLVELILDRIRNQDVMGVTVLYLLIFAIPLLISLPWYAERHLIPTWWDVPAYLFAVSLVLGVVFTVTRDYPWTIVIPATFLAGAAGLLVGFSVNPALLNAFVSGAGYFVKTKVYTTIAEAQEPGMSELVLSFGWFTFYIGLGALAYMIWQIPKRDNPAYTMLVMWAFGAIFMALSAARFIFNAAPIFALATGYALDLILTSMDFGGMRRTYRSLREGSWRNAVRKSIKPRHVITIVLIVFLVLLPNAWFAVDASIPFELKSTYDSQVNALLPPFLRASGYAQSVSSGSTFYFGAFGYTLPTENQYFPAAYQWLSTQDTSVPLDQRPAVLSWWDYGFEIAERGAHPAVADPFQNNFAIAGQVMLAQNETSAISLMAIHLIDTSYYVNHGFTPAMTATLQEFGLSPDVFVYALTHTSSLIPVILNNPQNYGYWASSLQLINVPYIFLNGYVTARLDETQAANLYQDVQSVTGWDIGYFMVDTRLFPLSSTNTGIFYAPAELSDHRTLTLTNGQVIPYDFFQIFADTSTASHVPVQSLSPADQVQSTSIEYQPMFYNSLFYRAFVGYSPTDLGMPSTNGIPGLSQNLTSYAPDPAWNLTHFRVAYRTAYYNPYPDPSNHTSAWQAMSYNDALVKQQEISAGKTTGVVDLSTQSALQNGLVILRYYDGALVNGTVTLGGRPMPNVWITATDELGTPHDLTKTDAAGHYSAIVPFGNITITASTGNLTPTTLVGAQTLTSTTLTVRVSQAMRVNEDLDGDGIPDWLITRNFAVPAQAVNGTAYFDLNSNGQYDGADVPAVNASLGFNLRGYGSVATATTNGLGQYRIPALPPGQYTVKVAYRGHNATTAAFTLTSTTTSQDLSIPFATLAGYAVRSSGTAVPGADLRITDQGNGTTWTITADATGAYTASPLLPGTYSVDATAGDQAAMAQVIVLNAGVTTQNVTLSPSGVVQGTTHLYGSVQPYATVSFQNAGSLTVIVQVTSDATGAYRVTLPAGTWNVNGRVYTPSGLFATIGRLEVLPGQNLAYDPLFVDGARVNGTLLNPTTNGTLRALIGFLTPTASWFLRSDAANHYVAFLPIGSYAVEATTSVQAYYGSVALTGSRSVDLPLANGTFVSGAVYWDSNHNGRSDAGEQVTGAAFDLTDNLGHTILAYTDPTGRFQITGLPGRTYSGTIDAYGFTPLPIPPTSLAGIGPGTNYSLTPAPVLVQGAVVVNGSALGNHPVTVRAIPLDSTALAANATTDSLGGFSLALDPGSYRLVVDENVTATSDTWRYQNLRPDEVNLSLGEGTLAHDLAIVARALVQGNVTLSNLSIPATLAFAGPDDAVGNATAQGFRVYLQPGTYTVSANHTASGTPYVFLANLTLPSAGNLSLALAPAIPVSGQLLYNGAPLTSSVTLTFERLEGGSFDVASAGTGTYTVYLASGNYTVFVNASVAQSDDGVPRFYRYSFQGTLALASGAGATGYNLALARTFDNTTVSGLVTVDGAGVDAQLRFVGVGGGALNATVSVPTSGRYDVALAPGAYVVYGVRGAGATAFLGRLVVSHGATTSYGVPLGPAHLLSGVVTDPFGAPIVANVTFQTLTLGTPSLPVVTNAAGAYSLLLPDGVYEVTGTRPGTDHGMAVTYRATAAVTLAADLIQNLALTKVETRSVALSWDASQNQTVAPGGSVTYTIAVRNTGNVADTYTFSGLPTIWSYVFDPSTVSLNYGNAGNMTRVRVTITPPSGALVNHGAVTLTATSTTEGAVQGSVPVSVGITRTQGLSLTLNPSSGTFDGTYLNYTVTLRNTGNDAQPATVGIANPSDIAASGWVPFLGTSGTTPTSAVVGNVTVPANSTVTLQLSLRRTTATGGATIVIQAMANDNPAVSSQTIYTVAPPGLQAPSPASASGSGILMTLPPNNELLALAIGAVAAVGVGLYITRKRR